MTTEVFKTNVTDRDKALWLVEQIQLHFNSYKASFDLDDCDKILVVRSNREAVRSSGIIELLARFNYCAEVLPDEW